MLFVMDPMRVNGNGQGLLEEGEVKLSNGEVKVTIKLILKRQIF